MSKNNESGNTLTVWQRIVVNLLWFKCSLLSYLPHFVLFYIVAPVVKFIIYRLLHYRRKVVDKNLAMALPEKSSRERSAIRSRYYTILSEIIISTLILGNERAAKRIMTLDGDRPGGVNVDAQRMKEDTAGRCWIGLVAHYGLYEYLLFYSQYAGQYLVAVYHPLKSKVIDELFRRLRSHKMVIPLPARGSLIFAIRNRDSYKGEKYFMGLIADQNPPHLADSHWYRFLGIDTLFFDGGEKMALRTGMPVNFVYQSRIGRGRYQLHYKPIWDGVESVEPHEITQRYVTLLEDQIRETPELWLWSHRRWKAVNNEKTREWREETIKRLKG